MLSREWVLDLTEPVYLVAERILVPLWLVWTPIERHCGWSEEDGRVPRIRKNRTGNSEPVGRIWNHPLHLHDKSGISTEDRSGGRSEGEASDF